MIRVDLYLHLFGFHFPLNSLLFEATFPSIIVCAKGLSEYGNLGSFPSSLLRAFFVHEICNNYILKALNSDDTHYSLHLHEMFVYGY